MKIRLVRHPRNKKGQLTSCPICGGDVTGPAVYDTNACRQKAYRIRNAQLQGRVTNVHENETDERTPDLPEA